MLFPCHFFSILFSSLDDDLLHKTRMIDKFFGKTLTIHHGYLATARYWKTLKKQILTLFCVHTIRNMNKISRKKTLAFHTKSELRLNLTLAMLRVIKIVFERVNRVRWNHTCILRREFSLDRHTPTAHNQQNSRWKKPDDIRMLKPRLFDPNITICVNNSTLPHAKRDTFTTLFLGFCFVRIFFGCDRSNGAQRDRIDFNTHTIKCCVAPNRAKWAR